MSTLFCSLLTRVFALLRSHADSCTSHTPFVFCVRIWTHLFSFHFASTQTCCTRDKAIIEFIIIERNSNDCTLNSSKYSMTDLLKHLLWNKDECSFSCSRNRCSVCPPDINSDIKFNDLMRWHDRSWAFSKLNVRRVNNLHEIHSKWSSLLCRKSSLLGNSIFRWELIMYNIFFPFISIWCNEFLSTWRQCMHNKIQIFSRKNVEQMALVLSFFLLHFFAITAIFLDFVHEKCLVRTICVY